MTIYLCELGRMLLMAIVPVVPMGDRSVPVAQNPAPQAASVLDIQYIGSEHLSKSELEKLTGVRTGDLMNPRVNQSGQQAILRKYWDEGRSYASVELTEGSKSTDTHLVYRITEGPVVTIADIQFKGNLTADTSRLLAAKLGGDVVTRKKFQPVAMDEGRKKIAEYYRGVGLGGTQVTPEVIHTVDVGRVIIVYHIAEAKK